MSLEVWQRPHEEFPYCILASANVNTHKLAVKPAALASFKTNPQLFGLRLPPTVWMDICFGILII